MTTKQTRHILGLSGGKDSAALAVYMRDRVPEMEYVFTDTQKELPETYDFLAKLEAYLGKPVIRLNAERGFDHWLQVYGNYLPSSRMRWCTRQLKLKPFEQYVGDGDVVSYVGIRADEDREGYISTKPNITARFPFKEDGLVHADILRILEEAGLGLPEYYKWRTRSGCYFCFFQRKSEWAGLLEHHPELYELAKSYEKIDPETGQRYTWQSGESLEELAQPDRLVQIRLKNDVRPRKASGALVEVLADEDEAGCAICTVLPHVAMSPNLRRKGERVLDLNPAGSLRLLSPRGHHGGWGTLLERLPRTPAVYAWFRHIAIPAELPPADFAREVEALVTAQTASVHSASLGPFHSVRLLQHGTLKVSRAEYLRAVSEDHQRRTYLASVLRRATSLQAPLYVGKARNLRQRVEQHLAPMSDLSVRLRDDAVLHLADCELVYTDIDADPDDDTFLRFVEELITYICRPGFVLRPGLERTAHDSRLRRARH